MSTPFRAGFACLVGRPNAGKSTLTNALVGQKVAITSSKPQTTRHTIRGVANTEQGQLILVDTPGLHKPRTLLGQRRDGPVGQRRGHRAAPAPAVRPAATRSATAVRASTPVTADSPTSTAPAPAAA